MTKKDDLRNENAFNFLTIVVIILIVVLILVMLFEAIMLGIIYAEANEVRYNWLSYEFIKTRPKLTTHCWEAGVIVHCMDIFNPLNITHVDWGGLENG